MKKIIIAMFAVVGLISGCGDSIEYVIEKPVNDTKVEIGNIEIIEQLLTVNEYSRPGYELEEVNGIVIHYIGNPGTTAEANRNYFQSLSYKGTTYASSHFIIGLEGEVVQCIPLDEQAFASKGRNKDTIAIEVCHPDAEGKFNRITYEMLVDLTAELCKIYGLTKEDVIRHYDVTGKICPRYYVENEEAWEILKNDIELSLKEIMEN